jgi:hypothetical protein
VGFRAEELLTALRLRSGQAPGAKKGRKGREGKCVETEVSVQRTDAILGHRQESGGARVLRYFRLGAPFAQDDRGYSLMRKCSFRCPSGSLRAGFDPAFGDAWTARSGVGKES